MSKQVLSDLRVIADWWKGRLNEGSVHNVETTPEVRDALSRFAAEMPGFADGMKMAVERPSDHLIWRMLTYSWWCKRTENMRPSEIRKVLEVFFEPEDIKRVVDEVCGQANDVDVSAPDLPVGEYRVEGLFGSNIGEVYRGEV